MPYLTLLFCLLLSFQNQAQFLTTDGSWALPMAEPVELSAGFGDLRPNHFHMGIDIRTGGKINLPIYACQDGFVSRIRVSSVGYGWVLYVQHPNGFTTVYAHCTRFADPIQQIYLDSASARQNNELDLILPQHILPIKKGEQIAFSGNSGGSTGPHLHFELRDTKTEHALNPFLHGFKVSDQATPVLKGIRVYAVDSLGYMIPNKAINVSLLAANHRVVLPAGFLAEGQKIGVALEVEDYFSKAGRSYGLFSTEITAEQQATCAIEFDEINFEHSRYINNHHDAAYAKLTKRKFQKAFRNVHDPLTIYPYPGTGAFAIQAKDSLQLGIMLRDVNGNEAQHTLMILNPNQSFAGTSFYNSVSYWLPNEKYKYEQGSWRIEIDSFTFYEPVLKKVNLSAKTIGSSSTYIQKPISISYRFGTENLPEKYCITMNGSPLSGTYEYGVLSATTKSLGVFGLKQDLLAPVIKENPKNTTDSTSTGRWAWPVQDDFSGINYYACFQNGKWVPAYYDAKNKFISAQFQVPFLEGDVLEIIVKDAVGNQAKKEWKIPAKPLPTLPSQPSE
ncbi:MAG: hypothetical protein RLZZ65_1674 [Bacteroidota bacterium]|jgi:hypothetical protein